jgi:hypothetical protein
MNYGYLPPFIITSFLKQVLFILDEDGEALKRTWVLFELWQAHLSCKQDKVVVLPASWTWEGSVHAFVSMDVATSRAMKALERTLLIDRMHKQQGLGQATDIIKVLSLNVNIQTFLDVIV